MNIFNDPDDFHIADAILAELKKLPKGTVTSIAVLFEKVAPGWEERDADLSGIDRAVRAMAIKNKIHLITPAEYRESPVDKAYTVPFIIR